jgi:glycosyltransferase involved in cell wall biosynthesis
MTASPRVAVLVPCFNHIQYLDEAIQSVLSQTFRDVEILVVNDGSTDPHTNERLAVAAWPQTRIVAHPENRGLSASRNTALRQTGAPYICALDADDRLAPAWLEKAVAFLDARPDVAFVSHWLRTFGDETWEWTPERCDLPALLARNTVNGAALVRRSALEAVGGFDESLRHGCEDWDVWLTLVERGFKGEIIPEVLFYYRRRAGSMSRAMLDGPVHVDLLRTLVRKHEASYRAHLADVVLEKEAELTALEREIWDLAVEFERALGPYAEREEEALPPLRAKAARLQHDLDRLVERDRLAAQVGALEREIADLRASRSWRLTAPLRALYGWFQRKDAP